MEAAPPDAGGMFSRRISLRRQALDAIRAFADNEDEIARIYDEMAAGRSGASEESRRIAADAREGARRAREFLHMLTG